MATLIGGKWSTRLQSSRYDHLCYSKHEQGTNDRQPIAEKLGISQSQLSLAWCLKNPHVSAVITGASRPEQIVENCATLKVLDKLTPEILAEIDEIVGKVQLDPARQD